MSDDPSTPPPSFGHGADHEDRTLVAPGAGTSTSTTARPTASSSAPMVGHADASGAPALPTKPAPAAAAAAMVRGHALFRRESLEAHLVAARDAEVLRVAPPWSRAVFWLATSLVATALALACLFDVEQTGFARGILRVAGGVQTVTALASGTVLEVGPRSGDVVAPGALLVRIDSAQTRASLFEAGRQIELAKQKLDEFTTRRNKDHAERVRLLREHANLLARRAENQERQAARLRAKQATYAKLVKDGLTSELQKGEVDDEVASAERETLRVREELSQTQLQIADIAAALAQERSQLEGALQQAKDKRDTLAVELTQTEVRAPRGGRLEAMLVKVGDSLSAGAPVGKLVPTDAPRQVVAFVVERDRAFLAEGAPARIEFDQLPSGEFGTLTGKVTRIASDLASPSEIAEAMPDAKLEEPVFRVELTLEPSENLTRLEQLLRPGSLVTARFALRHRRIITVIFEPLRRFFA
jgi:multidrug resistance efflux pump